MSTKYSLTRTIILALIINATISNSSTAQVIWSPIGPGGGGWITAMTIVNDEDNTIYVNCDVGGIYKSSDHGKTWEIKNEGLSMYFMHDIAYDPITPTTLYLASRGGVYKSTDAAETWVAMRDNFPPISDYVYSAPVSDIAIDPTNTDIVFAGIGVPNTGYDIDSYHWESTDIKGAIYKSTDGAEHWTLIQNTGIDTSAMIFSIEIDPINTNIVYTATNYGIYKSIDAGETWTTKNTGLPHTLTMSLAIDNINSDTLYVTLWAEPDSPNWQGGIYKSINGGDSWTAKNNGIPQVMGPESGFTTNFPDLIIDTNNPQILYTGNIPWTPKPGIFKTIDGGENWIWVTRDEGPNQNVDVGWITQHSISGVCLTIDPNNSSDLYFGSSTHIIKTTNAGDNWSQCYTSDMGSGYWKGNGFETTVVQKVNIDPTNSNHIYAGYWDLGFLKSIDGGESFKRTTEGMTYKSNTFDIEIDPDTPSTVYAATGWWEMNEGEICKSTDYGESWTPLTNGIPNARIWSIAVDTTSPIDSRTIYVTSHQHGIYKTTDGGQQWYPINNGLGVNSNYQLKKITIDPNNSNVLYAGIEAKQIENDNTNSTIQGGLFKSVDAGANWIRIDIGLTQLSVNEIKIDPNDSQIIYTGVYSGYDHTDQTNFKGGVYKSIDGGATWMLLNNGFGDSENLNVSGIVINPSNTDIIYAVTTDAPFHDNSNGRGIFKSIDAGKTWVSVNNGLTIHYSESITLDPNNPEVIYVGSAGNGIIKGIDNDIIISTEYLDYFTAHVNNNKTVKLQWTTLNNSPINKFNINRSLDGLQWSTIKTWNLPEPNSSIPYSFIDTAPTPGLSFYQITQTNKNGDIFYSPIARITIKKPTIINIHPNPSNSLITVKVQNIGGSNLDVYDMNGKKVTKLISILRKTKNKIELDITKLNVGVYFVKINNSIKKILKF